MTRLGKFLAVEAPVAILDDAKFGKQFVGAIAKFAMDKYRDKVTEVKVKDHELLIYFTKDKRSMSIGRWGKDSKELEKDRFGEIGRIDILPYERLKSIDDLYKNTIRVSKVFVSENFRGQGIGSQLYLTLLSLGYNILSNSIQYNGARKLYSKLSKRTDIVADLIDVSELIVLKKDIDVYQSDDEWDFDPDIWSYDLTKSNIRILLRSI